MLNANKYKESLMQRKEQYEKLLLESIDYFLNKANRELKTEFKIFKSEIINQVKTNCMSFTLTSDGLDKCADLLSKEGYIVEKKYALSYQDDDYILVKLP